MTNDVVARLHVGAAAFHQDSVAVVRTSLNLGFDVCRNWHDWLLRKKCLWYGGYEVTANVPVTELD